MATAQKDAFSCQEEAEDYLEERETFDCLLEEWASTSMKLLSTLKEKPDYISKGKSPQSIMALGALEAHLRMAVHSKEVSGMD